jgi:hypothetical protein
MEAGASSKSPAPLSVRARALCRLLADRIDSMNDTAAPLDFPTRIRETEAERDALRAEVEGAEAASLLAAGQAHLDGKAPPSSAALDKLRGRLRAVQGALVLLAAERDRTAAEETARAVADLEREAAQLQAERRAAYVSALAAMTLAHRLMGWAVEHPGGGYAINGRLNMAGIVDRFPVSPFARLDAIRGALVRLGLKPAEADRIAKPGPHALPGGPGLAGHPLAAEARERVAAMESTLAAAGLMPALPPL